MQRRKRRRVWLRAPGLLWLLSVALVAVGILVDALIVIRADAGAGGSGLDLYTIAFLVLAPLYATVGALIVSRGGGNRVGWIIGAIGLLLAVTDSFGALATYAHTRSGRSLPGAVWFDWVSNWSWVPAVVGALALLPLFFPDGHMPSRR